MLHVPSSCATATTPSPSLPTSTQHALRRLAFQSCSALRLPALSTISQQHLPPTLPIAAAGLSTATKPARKHRRAGKSPPRPPAKRRHPKDASHLKSPWSPTAGTMATRSVDVKDVEGNVLESVSITFSEKELELFTLLRKFIAECDDVKGTTVRVAGGWVRDKILARPSHDIDIALDLHTGEDFANHLNEYLERFGMATNRVHTIEANPDQSKHLATARVWVLGEEIDFVNLRTETYTEDSRIPTASFGTAEEDALRRDFTINAMFYNVGEGVVEDMTNKGMSDLKAGVIRTPLAPKTTFLDDPLRVMRAVRFASRYRFTLCPDLLASVKDDEVKAALMTKITRERIGQELDGMMAGPHPNESLFMLHDVGLLPYVFVFEAAPTGDAAGAGADEHPFKHKLYLDDDWANPVALVRHCYDAVTELGSGFDITNPTPADSDSVVNRRRLLLLAAITFGHVGETYPLKGGKTGMKVSYAIMEGVKRKRDDSNGILAMHAACPTLMSLLCDLDTPDLRLQAGLAIRQLKDLWPLALLLARAVLIQQGKPEAGENVHTLHERVTTWGLTTAWQLKPVLNGKALMKPEAEGGLGLVGKALAPALQRQIEYLIVHPDATAEDIMDHLKSPE